MTLQLWDTAGQERFQSLCTSFYRGSDCCVLVFDLTDPNSLAHVQDWRRVFRETAGDDIPVLVVANKKDLERKIGDRTDEWVEVSAV